MAAVATAPRPEGIFRSESEMLNTIPDPRSPSPITPVSRHGSTDSGRHPDLSAEVATLSTKLVNAINHQTNLDDSLQVTRHELDAARETIATLQAEAKAHSDLVQQGFWVKREELDTAQSGLKKEQDLRKAAEIDKKKMESELENLTTALFEEANTMVAAARKETEACEKRNEQLKHQLQDAEILLRSHQEQLHDLKSVVEKMSSERDENESNAHSLTAPSTPGVSTHDKVARMLDSGTGSPITPNSEGPTPDHPLRFSHLIHPVLRSDLTAYKEFQELLRQGRIFSRPPSRVGSGNYGKLNILGLASLDSSQNGNAPSNGSTTSLPLTSPLSATSTSPRTSTNLPPLKDAIFFKRAITEDIEPTLRLDQAPGVSWMGRRTVITSIINGSLVVEPHPYQKHRAAAYACALCGENRSGEQYIRRHRFKTTEAEDAQRYPLCDWCMGRLRSTCDYVGFLRMVQAGHWRADSEEEMKSAWEETVRFRERMFWSRVGGGVIPAIANYSDLKSPVSAKIDGRQSEDTIDTTSTGIVQGVSNNTKQDDPFTGEMQAKRESSQKAVAFKTDGVNDKDVSSDTSPQNTSEEDLASKQLQDEHEKASAKSAAQDTEMSVTIPGSFD